MPTNDTDLPTIIHESLNGAEEPVMLIGKNMKTINNRRIYAFQGIMYGEAMEGEHRFKVTHLFIIIIIIPIIIIIIIIIIISGSSSSSSSSSSSRKVCLETQG